MGGGAEQTEERRGRKAQGNVREAAPTSRHGFDDHHDATLRTRARLLKPQKIVDERQSQIPPFRTRFTSLLPRRAHVLAGRLFT